MRTEYTWEIKIKNTPALERKCNRCNCNKFYCSNKFRMNAQKKNIDVWLIYRCMECDSTYNLTILSRTKPELIRKDLFTKFSDNDEDIAWEYAFSLETARKNNVKFDYNSVEYEIEHDNISINDILNAGDESVVFKIQTGFEFELKLSSVIRYCLGVSASQLNQMIEVDAVFTPEGYPIKKHKVKNGDIVLINKEKLQGIKSLGSV
ncbi:MULTISPECIES: DUF1062 domain-containing protein [unclassified Butyricimonas]|uniref:DUF1062 domain-containing protein n=1 Tax=Butyricimonas TaxID=574697 RepID=UPI000C07E140|nr:MULTISPECIES: DUF1062 domain-containing protein [unclassified Butyricimonas]